MRSLGFVSFSFQPCPENLTDSVGAIQVDRTVPSWKELRAKYIKSARSLPQTYSGSRINDSLRTWLFVHNFSQGGTPSFGLWSPVECRPRQTVAVIIPFRDREAHLRVFLNHMHTLFRHQQLLYSIFVIEQVGKTIFNRAALFNVGFLESDRLAQFDCFIFHDVDLLPQDDRIPYRCTEQPIHLSVALDRYNYKLPYATLFGGAVALTRDQFKRVRGFSNCFFGWGGEDDDMYIRVRHYGYQIFRHPPSIARYTMLSHTREKLNQPNPARHKLLLNSRERLLTDGFPETDYTLVSAKPMHDGLVYWIAVDLAENRIRHKFNLTIS
ncbi:unnamed protein product [Dicrocoelium dendriticum]|nr:unnamed protein product [Dicrocoelium dendriticum]